MMLESNVWGENSFLFTHTTWIGNDLLKIRKWTGLNLFQKLYIGPPSLLPPSWKQDLPDVSPIVSFPPSFARTSRETSGYEAAVVRCWIRYTWARESLMMFRRQMPKEMTQVHQNLRRVIPTFLPSFLQECSMQSLLHQGIIELFKSLIFQIGRQIPTEWITAALCCTPLN